jgi:hypothetical protein
MITMTVPWNSLYFPSEDRETIAAALRDSLTALGYELHDPFGLIPGKAYGQTIRLFVAPSGGGWTRVLGAPDAGQFAYVSERFPCLYLALDGETATIAAYAEGRPAPIEVACAPYLKPGYIADDLKQVMVGARHALPLQDKQSSFPLDALPDEVKSMAKGVNPEQAGAMFNRLTGQLMKKIGGGNAQADAARALIAGAPAWESAGGAQIRSLAACLTLPENWRSPDFTAVRDAYQLHNRRANNPNARLYPGDDVIMAQVPHALDYTPIYGGKNS